MDFLWIGGIGYVAVCVRAGGYLGLGAVCLGLVVGRLLLSDLEHYSAHITAAVMFQV